MKFCLPSYSSTIFVSIIFFTHSGCGFPAPPPLVDRYPSRMLSFFCFFTSHLFFFCPPPQSDGCYLLEVPRWYPLLPPMPGKMMASSIVIELYALSNNGAYEIVWPSAAPLFRIFSPLGSIRASLCNRILCGMWWCGGGGLMWNVWCG